MTLPALQLATYTLDATESVTYSGTTCFKQQQSQGPDTLRRLHKKVNETTHKLDATNALFASHESVEAGVEYKAIICP